MRELALVAGASAPAAVAGLLAADAVEERLGRPSQLAALLAGFGALMWWVDASAARRSGAERPGEQGLPVTARQAAVASVAQVAALVPGVSRSGATLTALRALGVSRAQGERFSLLLSLPVAAGAASLTLARARSVPPGSLTGAASAAVAGHLATVRLRARPGRPLGAAALYRLGLAAVVARRLLRERER